MITESSFRSLGQGMASDFRFPVPLFHFRFSPALPFSLFAFRFPARFSLNHIRKRLFHFAEVRDAGPEEEASEC